MRDIDVANMIWGKSVAALKGKTVRSKPKPVRADAIMIPRELKYLQKSVMLVFDIFFVDMVPFFLTVSRKLRYTTITHLAKRTCKVVFNAFVGVYKFYLCNGFTIKICNGDPEFAPLQVSINGMSKGPQCNLSSKGSTWRKRNERFGQRRTTSVAGGVMFLLQGSPSGW